MNDAIEQCTALISVMRSINVRYLLTYFLLTYCGNVDCQLKSEILNVIHRRIRTAYRISLLMSLFNVVMTKISAFFSDFAW